MIGHRKWMWILAALTASSTALAQASEEGGGRAVAPNAGEWRSYPTERHVIGRVQGGVGLRLFDPYSAGPLAPGWVHGQAGFLFINAGKLRMGPTLGGQLGIDAGHSGLQGTIQPGWALMYRPASRWAILGRLDVPFLFTRTWDRTQDACIYLVGAVPRPGQPDTRRVEIQGQCQPNNMLPARVPYGNVPSVGIGVEGGGTFAFFLTGGFALTAELNAGIYFGDSGVSVPLLGVGLGAMIDYELLP